MSINTGSILYDKRRGSWYGLLTYTENGKRIYKRVYGDNKSHARQRLDELRDKIKRGEHTGPMTFAALAEDFKTKRLIEARYIGEKKIAGRRELSAPRAWLKRLTDHFGLYRLDRITPAEIEAYKLQLAALPNKRGEQRSIAAINRELEFLRTVLNHAVASGWLTKNPFSATTKKLIEKSHETKRERLLGFGEELALLAQCVDERAHLRAIIIMAVDTGLRRNELFTLDWRDIDWQQKTINVRAFNAKSNRERSVPMSPRVYGLLGEFAGKSGLIFDGLHDIKRAFGTAKRKSYITDLTYHDLRHAFVSRAILAGVPPAFVLKASGHASDEWRRYLNVAPESLNKLLSPMNGQTTEEVQSYAREVMLGLRSALRFDAIESLLSNA